MFLTGGQPVSNGNIKLSAVYIDCCAHTDCKFRWKVRFASSEQIRDLCDESFSGTHGFIFQQKDERPHQSLGSDGNVRWMKKNVVRELMGSDHVSERCKEMQNDARYDNSWIPSVEVVHNAKSKV